jgi:carbon starvation protein
VVVTLVAMAIGPLGQFTDADGKLVQGPIGGAIVALNNGLNRISGSNALFTVVDPTNADPRIPAPDKDGKRPTTAKYDAATGQIRTLPSYIFWVLFLLVFSYLGSVLPIWRFAQPVNYIGFWVTTLIIGLSALGAVLGIFTNPQAITFQGAAFKGLQPVPAGPTAPIQPLWPMLFVTIACGAISGWHSLVSTSGTARQLQKETDALPVGGGAMFMESAFAIMAFLIATVAFGSFKGYQDAGGAAKALGVFSQGLANFLDRIGIPHDFGVAYGSVFLTIMAITIMQLVVRFMRVASAEMLGDRFPAMKNIHVGSIIALLLTLLFVLIIPWLTIWSAFGASNQLMAGLALLLVSLWLMSEGKRHTWALYPSIFMIVTDIGALLFVAYSNLFKALPAAKTTEAAIAAVIIGLICLVLVAAALVLISDGWQAIQRVRATKKVAA